MTTPPGSPTAILEAKAAGCELIFTTGGMSVDPDDRTPLAIKNTGAEIITYGAPVLPGAMFLVSYLDGVPVCGLPGCVMYAKRTIFDLLLPRLLADDPITAEDIARSGRGRPVPELRSVPLAQLRLWALLRAACSPSPSRALRPCHLSQRERLWQRDEVCVDCQGLPLWGSWHRAAMTERARTFAKSDSF